MSMNETHCKRIGTLVYWYNGVLVQWCIGTLDMSMNETHCKRIGTLWKQFRTVSPQPLAVMSKLFVTLFLLGPKAQIRWSCVIGRKLLTTAYWYEMEVVLMEAT